MFAFEFLDIAEGLMQLDPVRTYPERAASLVATLAGARGYRLELDQGAIVESDPRPDGQMASVSLPLRGGKQSLATLHLFLGDGPARLGANELRLARWGARVLARGLVYAQRLSAEGRRRGTEDVEATLARAPLTPRERDVVSLLVSGASTRDIASRTQLTTATVNTYLKRIFSKLGVHSRVELVARMAGTESSPAAAVDTSDGADEPAAYS